MGRKPIRKRRRAGRRQYSDELKAEAVQMQLDGHVPNLSWRIWG